MRIRKSPIKLAIVDDHKLFRRGLMTLIDLADKKDEYLILFEAGNGQEMIRKLDKKAIPDIILLDIEMPDMDGYETIGWLKKHYPEVSVLVISMVQSEEAVVRMLKMGAKGYLSKDIEVEDIQKALKSITETGNYFTDYLTGKLINYIQDEEEEKNSEGNPNNKTRLSLSENELTFIKLACTELKYEQIAEKMCLSVKTIDGYRSNLFTRYKIKTRVGLALFAIKKGLVTISPEDTTK